MKRLGHVWIREIARFSSRIDLYNFGRWLVLALMVGVVAGLGGTLLTWGVKAISSGLLGSLVGFSMPGHGEAATVTWSMPERPWLLLVVLPLLALAQEPAETSEEVAEAGVIAAPDELFFEKVVAYVRQRIQVRFDHAVRTVGYLVR